MLDPEVWERFLQTGPPHLFHVTPVENVERILAEGLRPGSDLGRVTRRDFFSTRAGHTYVVKQADVPVIEVRGEPRVIAVELGFLDPQLIDPDEDIVQHHLAVMVETNPPTRKVTDGREDPGQDGLLARWADTTPGFDGSEVTERCLYEHQRISYRGTIPPAALSLAPMQSEHLAHFVQDIRGDLDISAIEVPYAGMARTELERARQLGEAVIEGVVELVPGVAAVHVELSNHDAAADIAHSLRRVAAELRRGDASSITRSVVIGEAANVAQAAAEIEDLGVRTMLDSALAIAKASATALLSVATELGSAEHAARVARSAVERASDVPWRTGAPSLNETS